MTATATTIRGKDGINLVVEIKVELVFQVEIHAIFNLQEPETQLMKNLKNLRKAAKVTYIAELEPKAKTAVEQLRPVQVGDKLEPGQLRATFRSLDKDENYTVTIKTLINGKAMCSFKKEFTTGEL